MALVCPARLPSHQSTSEVSETSVTGRGEYSCADDDDDDDNDNDSDSDNDYDSDRQG